MKILIVNGSPRPNGATGQLLHHIRQTLEQLDACLEFEAIDLGKYPMKLCTGCLTCYKTGACYIKDDGLEALSHTIAASDAVIFGSPTYASNVSGHLKILIDRGHFVFEQLLRDKACFSVVTYENAGGGTCQKTINELIRYSGGSVSASFRKKLAHNTKAVDETTTKALQKPCENFLRAAKRPISLSPPERLLRHLIFHLGLRPHAEKDPTRYKAILEGWKTQGYTA